jgi:hypothetical protein
MTVYALLVGVDVYLGDIRPLRGAKNDAQAAEAYLASNLSAAQLCVKTLLNEEATRDAVIAGFRGHLSRAGSLDTALFWFSGHGSEAPVPPELAHLEPTGMVQTVVCHDSRRGGVPDLIDKEIAVLVAEVAARGTHVVLVMDCCHAYGSSRIAAQQEADTRFDQATVPATDIREAPPAQEAPDISSLLPELAGLNRAGEIIDPTGGLPRHVDHVALAACHSYQLAHEIRLGDTYRGVFSVAILEQLERLGRRATYRELMTGARCYVEEWYPNQQPRLYPEQTKDVLGDRPFLGGELRNPAAALTMRWVHGGWEVDAGSCHGIDAGTVADAVTDTTTDTDADAATDTATDSAAGSTRFGVVEAGGGSAWGGEPRAGDVRTRECAVVEVLPERSLVEPLGWTPDPLTQYPVVVTRIPMPPTTVALTGSSPDDSATAMLLVEAVRHAGLDGGPSPHLGLVAADESAGSADSARPPQLHVSVPFPGFIRVCGGDLKPLVSDMPCATRTEAAAAVGVLEHIARWRQIRSLANPASRLAGAVRIEVVEAEPGDRFVPAGRACAHTDADGALKVEYSLVSGRWVPPRVFIRLRNTTEHDLYCVLLDLTDRFRVHPGLFPGDRIKAGYTAAAARGGAITLRLPTDRAVKPGAFGTDYLKLLISEQPFSCLPFELPGLREPIPGTNRESEVYRAVFGRLGLIAVHRDADPECGPPHDWATTMLPVITRVPSPAGRG